MRGRNRSSALHVYVLIVCLAGFGTIAVLAGSGGVAAALRAPAAFWLLAACLLVSDWFWLPVPGRDGVDLITTIDAFAFALLLGWGVAPATLVLAAGSAVSDLAHRRPPLKAAFNAAQYGLVMVAAGGAYRLAGGRVPFGTASLPALVAAAVVYYVGNLVLIGVVTTLDGGSSFRRHLRESLRTDAAPSAMLFGIAPIFLIVLQRSLGLLPLALLPIAAVYLAFRSALQAEEHRRAAERAAERARALAAEQARVAQAEHLLVERLRESDRLKDDLLATVSHELRTPLAGMLGALSTLGRRHERLSASQRQELIGMAVRQGERLRELIEQLLLAARFEHAAGELDVLPVVDVAELARAALAAARLAHPGRMIELAAGVALPVRAAPEAVAQVLGNLVDNAAKYAPDATPIRLEAARAGGLAVLAVSDQGPGVPARERERVFERFTQLDSGATRRAGGVGLGLYIARQLAQAQGGELLLAEAGGGGRGARFELRLPLADPRAERSRSAAAVSMIGQPPIASGPAAVSGWSWRSPASTR